MIYLIGELVITKELGSLYFLENQLLKWTLFIIMIIKPVNTSFKILFQRYAPEEFNAPQSTIEGAGAMIGNLERVLIAILIFYNQFGAIGLVFTAKSVARFDKISKNPAFAEYYLIGSLYSIISVLLCYAIIIH